MRSFAVLLCLSVVVHVADSARAENALSDELYELWSEAYEVDAVEAEAAPVAMSGSLDRETTRSLTPHLDGLLHGSERGSTPVTSPAAPRPLGHDTFFENPPMTMSKGFHDENRRRGRHRHRDRDDDDHKKNNPCGHQGQCGCWNPTPTPEPGTLLLAGVATATAWTARRRRARRCT